jgi:methionyl-tRNA formyltransferase
MSDARIVFAGTPEFARASLKALVDSDNKPIAVLTQPDRPAGRGKKLTASPVKEFAVANNIDVMQPTTLKDDDVVAQLEALDADIMIVAAYGLLLPQNVLDIPRCGCLNVHASLLPRWRGAAPLQAAILAGDEQTGVCLMSMTAGLDCGPVFAATALDIGAEETAGELHDRLATTGGELLVEQLPDILAGNKVAREQDESLATYAPKIKTSDAEIDWQRPASEFARLVRAYNPVPGAYFMFDEQRIKCWRAQLVTDEQGAPGQVLCADAEGVVVACAEGALRLLELQRPGKRRVNAAEFTASAPIAGRRL